MSGHKIFISYKYYDNNVYKSIEHEFFKNKKYSNITPRDYVDVLETYIKEYSPHYYKAEEDNNDLSQLDEDKIWEILKTKIFDSTLTIIMISPKMKENKRDRDQWIPWEIQYSLGIQNRKKSNGSYVRSNTNAMMAIVLPDSNNSYNYYFEEKQCCNSKCILNKTDSLFDIIKKNTFNLKNNDNQELCNNKNTIYYGDEHSFIPFYKWEDINSKEKMEKAINHSYKILSQKDKYDICHEID